MPEKFSTTVSSIKVMSNLSLKIRNFNIDFSGGKQLKIMMVTKALSSSCNFRKVFQENFVSKCDFKYKNIKKTESSINDVQSSPLAFNNPYQDILI